MDRTDWMDIIRAEWQVYLTSYQRATVYVAYTTTEENGAYARYKNLHTCISHIAPPPEHMSQRTSHNTKQPSNKLISRPEIGKKVTCFTNARMQKWE